MSKTIYTYYKNFQNKEGTSFDNWKIEKYFETQYEQCRSSSRRINFADRQWSETKIFNEMLRKTRRTRHLWFLIGSTIYYEIFWCLNQRIKIYRCASVSLDRLRKTIPRKNNPGFFLMEIDANIFLIGKILR